MSPAFLPDHNVGAAQPEVREKGPLLQKEGSATRRSRITPSPVRSEQPFEDELKEKGFFRQSSTISSMWEQRRRRKDVRSVEDHSPSADLTSSKEPRKSRARSKQRKSDEIDNNEDEDDIDPYDSDPGESYRQHCMKVGIGTGSRSCMGVPNFFQPRKSSVLRNSRDRGYDSNNRRGAGDDAEEDTVLTSPPSPLASDMGDPYGQLPPSLPRRAPMVRYSLRSAITDGAERQPMGPSVMERRDLRPNGVHLNISHWSDAGGRAYMEDRYV